ncbi:MAG: YitT family protein [Actinomycetota bacterium]|nr:YitT family protein [Actinomycetota bacterium]
MTVTGARKLSPDAILRNRPLRDYTLITIGILLTGWGLDAFLIPNKIAAGGVSGLATVFFYTAKDLGITLPIGIQMLVMNVALLFLALRARGWRYAARTIYGIVGLSLAIDLLAPITPRLAQHDLLLAALYGGAVCGLGLGLVFKAGGNTGGTDIIAQLLAKKVPLGVGQLMLMVDAVVTVVAALKFGPDLALYGAVAIFVSGSTIDLVLEGLSVEKAAFIISNESERISSAIITDLGRGCTAISARGVFSGQAREMLFVVVSRTEIDALKSIINTLDPTALLVISDVHEAIGEGFKEMRQ